MRNVSATWQPFRQLQSFLRQTLRKSRMRHSCCTEEGLVQRWDIWRGQQIEMLNKTCFSAILCILSHYPSDFHEFGTLHTTRIMRLRVSTWIKRDFYLWLHRDQRLGHNFTHVSVIMLYIALICNFVCIWNTNTRINTWHGELRWWL